MFDYMTTEAARIEHAQRMAHLDAFGAQLPVRPSFWARIVARVRRTSPVAPVLTLPTREAATAADAAAA